MSADKEGYLLKNSKQMNIVYMSQKNVMASDSDGLIFQNSALYSHLKDVGFNEIDLTTEQHTSVRERVLQQEIVPSKDQRQVCLIIITARIRRIGKVLFSQLSLCPQVVLGRGGVYSISVP